MRKSARQVAQAMGEQGRAARELIKAAQNTSSVAAQVRRGTTEQARVKEELLKMAAELLDLYAARKAHPRARDPGGGHPPGGPRGDRQDRR